MTLVKTRIKTPDELAKLPIVGDQPKSEKEEKFLREVCEFEFFNLEEPGLMHTFNYGDTRNSYKFEFLHGGKYKVPRFVARFLESKGTPIWKRLPDGSGAMQKQNVGRNTRFRMSQTYS